MNGHICDYCEIDFAAEMVVGHLEVKEIEYGNDTIETIFFCSYKCMRRWYA
jgi:hypothetical protein